jgi:hypothetical protein
VGAVGYHKTVSHWRVATVEMRFYTRELCTALNPGDL